MTLTAMRLVDGATEMVLYPRDNLIVLGLAPGSPSIRAVVENRADGDGEVDTTLRYGARTVALDLRAIDTPAAFLDELTFFTRPSARPYLYVEDDEWAQARRLRLRAEQWSAPLDAEQAPYVREMQAQWRCPDGVWESDDETSVIVGADAPASVGFFAPFSAPLSLTATDATNSAQTSNVGNVETHFTARMYGPCSAPRLVNDLTGEELTFSSALVLAAGEYIEVDTQARTALLNSSASSSRLGYVDFSVSTWWQVQPGLQDIRFAPTSPTAGSQAEITYRPRWL